ncbi:MAG: glycosyltransferase [Nitrospinales bacterium]
MRILGHIHTFNDEEVIDKSLKSLLEQTLPLDEILIVDNNSTDNTLKRTFPKNTHIIRHHENLGTSGAVFTGFKYALENNYDWIWIFDGDSAPHKDALEILINLYYGLPKEEQEKTWLISGLPVDIHTKQCHHGMVFDAKGLRQVNPDALHEYYPFDATMWTASLYNLRAVKNIGLPSIDYVLDWGEYQYGYKGKINGLKAYMHQKSIVDHNIGHQSSLNLKPHRLGPISLKMIEFPPIRCYYLLRNNLYFWLHEYNSRSFYILLSCLLFPGFYLANFILRPISHKSELWACLRGIWDGLLKNMQNRY